MSAAANRLPEINSVPVRIDAPHWCAVYTYPRHEKSVAEQLKTKSLEAFLPTYATRSRWKDRSVQICRPLFPGYVFTRISLEDRIKVITVPSVVRILSFNGRPADVSDQEIESIRLCLGGGANLEAHPFPEIGESVRVCSGAFEGVEGVVVNSKDKCKVIVSISLIHQSVALEIDAKHLEPVRYAPRV